MAVETIIEHAAVPMILKMLTETMVVVTVDTVCGMWVMLMAELNP